ncbi:MAG: sigma-54 dependent transcriptional regulator [bacterium]|nr:sigma-54 dependent transcriptional regulator [bacterium]
MPNRIGLRADMQVGLWSRFIGESPCIREMKAFLELIAAGDATILLWGEKGVGKEVAAQESHAMSARASGPFVVVDCSALPAELIENELFGHGRGAFTGAFHPQQGLLEAAGGGTLFLDQIEDMPLHLQSRLLRFIENREVRRIGETDYHPVDARVIVATRIDLAEAARQRKFRDDLYDRLNEFSVRIPPLRERDGDIALLARHFLESPEDTPIPEEVIGVLAQHAWPGNVRELKNVISRAKFFSSAAVLNAGAVRLALNGALRPEPAVSLPLSRSTSGLTRQELRGELRAMERRWVLELMERTDGNLSKAAELTGTRHTSSVANWVKRCGLQREVAEIRLRSRSMTDRPTP